MKVVVIGTGFGAHVMAPAYEAAGFTTTVVSPRDDAALARAAAGDVDLVSVHSPPFLHHQHVMLALDHKRAVLCDKPFGRNAQEARSLRDRARALGVPNFVNFELRWQTGRARLKQLLDEGAIGALQHVNWTMFGDGLRRQKHGWLFDADLGGGWIGAYGAHLVDALRWLTRSEIDQLGGVARTEIPSRLDREGAPHAATAEDAFSAWFALENGCTASFDTAFSASIGAPERLLLLGSEGALELVGDLHLTLRRPGREPEAVDLGAPETNGYAQALRPWLAAVREAIGGGPQIAPSFDDGVATAEVLDRLHASVFRARR